MPQALQLDKAGKLKLSEADVVRQVEDFLFHRGWRIYKTGYGEITRDGRVVDTVGEEGMPDKCAVRYNSGRYCELIWLEFKRPKCKGDSGGKLRKSQVTWMAIERARGALCLVPDSIETFMAWYRAEIGRR